MTKTKQKPAGRERLPKMPGMRQWDADDRAAWRGICQLSTDELRKWAIVYYKDQRDMYLQLTEIRRLRAEEAEFYKRELAVVRRENLGRIQSNLMQTLQNMMAALEGNSRAESALAEPIGDMLRQLGKELDRPSWQERLYMGARGGGKTDAAREVMESGIPSHWPQPGERKK